jgi:hypothetical protein
VAFAGTVGSGRQEWSVTAMLYPCCEALSEVSCRGTLDVTDDIFGPKYTYLLRTRAYLRVLPTGLQSYPQCVSKGQVWRNILRETDTRSLVGRLPSELAIVPDADILAGAWIPAVQSFAGHLALRDCLFRTDEEIFAHFRMLDRKLFGGPVYRVMFALASPMMALHGADRSFATMFRGITLKATSQGSGQARLELRYPADLLPSLVGRLYLIAFEVAVEMAGGKAVAGRMLTHGQTEAVYEMTWR